MKQQKIIYYHDELNDDFASNNIKTIETPDDYNYVNHSWFYKTIEFIIYRIIVTPFVFLYIKIKYNQVFKNKKVIRRYLRESDKGYFLYFNHTNGDSDAFIPSIVSFPKKAYIICNPDAISIKGIKTLVAMLGALPVPYTIKTKRNFKEAIEYLVNKGKVIAIYPEAHIWPYYTDIRPFIDVSFRYPVDMNVASFAITNVYKKRRLFKKPRIVSYVDGPFYKKDDLNRKDAMHDLRCQVYEAMKYRVDSNPKYEYIKYIKVDDEKNPYLN